MAILTVSELREHIETDLADTALQRLADAAEETIDREDGGTAAVTENFNEWGFPRGRNRVIYSSRSISSITSIKERDDPDDAGITVAADDYRQEGNRALVRLRDGTNPRLFWAHHIEVILVPVVDGSIRKEVQVNLVKFALNYTGAMREKHGDFEFWHRDTGKEMSAVLAPLRNARNQMPLR